MKKWLFAFLIILFALGNEKAYASDGDLPYWCSKYQYSKFYISSNYMNEMLDIQPYFDILNYYGVDVSNIIYFFGVFEQSDGTQYSDFTYFVNSNSASEYCVCSDRIYSNGTCQYHFFEYPTFDNITVSSGRELSGTLRFVPGKGFIVYNSYGDFPGVNFSKLVSYKSNVRCYLELFGSADELSQYKYAIKEGSVEADNESDFLPSRYGVLEVPQNLSVTTKEGGFFSLGESDTLVVKWSQTDENYKNWETEFLFYGSYKYRNTLLIFGDWHYANDLFWFDDTIYTRRLSYTVDLDSIIWSSGKLEQAIYDDLGYISGTTGHIVDTTFYLRNKYNDGEYNYYSNWIRVTINSDGEVITDEERQSSFEEIEYDDDKKGDSGQNFADKQPDGNLNADSIYDGSTQTSIEGNEMNLISSIETGFGLLGDNGIIAMLSDLFTYVPNEIWILVCSGIGIMVLIAVFKFVK